MTNTDTTTRSAEAGARSETEGQRHTLERSGRPTKCTPEVRKRIVDMVRAGVLREQAARAAGVGLSTFYRWWASNRSPYREFREALLDAEATASANMQLRVTKAAQEGDWKAAAWWLERRFPKEFGRKDRHIIEDAEGREVIPLAFLREAVRRARGEDDHAHSALDGEVR